MECEENEEARERVQREEAAQRVMRVAGATGEAEEEWTAALQSRAGTAAGGRLHPQSSAEATEEAAGREPQAPAGCTSRQQIGRMLQEAEQEAADAEEHEGEPADAGSQDAEDPQEEQDADPAVQLQFDQLQQDMVNAAMLEVVAVGLREVQEQMTQRSEWAVQRERAAQATADAEHEHPLVRNTTRTAVGSAGRSTPETSSAPSVQPVSVAHQPTNAQHEGPGMPPGGNNTSSSDFQDIEHQPGPGSNIQDAEHAASRNMTGTAVGSSGRSAPETSSAPSVQPVSVARQPTKAQHEGPGMPPGGNNTSSSAFQDIEHQPGPGSNIQDAEHAASRNMTGTAVGSAGQSAPETSSAPSVQPVSVAHQPTKAQHEGPGMPPGGNNTSSSAFQDIEHQPGPGSNIHSLNKLDYGVIRLIMQYLPRKSWQTILPTVCVDTRYADTEGRKMTKEKAKEKIVHRREWNTATLTTEKSTPAAKQTQQFINQPVTIQHHGPGMPSGGDNTTSSDYEDIEHQPGPWTVVMEAGPKDAANTTEEATSAEETTVRGRFAERGLEDLTNTSMKKDNCDIELMKEIGLDDNDLDFLEINDATQHAILQEVQTATSEGPEAVMTGPKTTDECYRSSYDNCKGVGACDACNKQLCDNPRCRAIHTSSCPLQQIRSNTPLDSMLCVQSVRNGTGAASAPTVHASAKSTRIAAKEQESTNKLLVITVHIQCAQNAIIARDTTRRIKMRKGLTHSWRSVIISGIIGSPDSVAIVAIKEDTSGRELLDCLVDAGALLLSERHIASMWLGGEEIEQDQRDAGGRIPDGSILRLKILENGPQIRTAKVGTLMPRLTNSLQMQRLQEAGATIAELDTALEAGIEGFRCNCRFAGHFNRQCNIWLPSRGTCPVCQTFTEKDGVLGCSCACTACAIPEHTISFPCSCTKAMSQGQHCLARFAIPGMLCDNCLMCVWGDTATLGCHCYCQNCTLESNQHEPPVMEQWCHSYSDYSISSGSSGSDDSGDGERKAYQALIQSGYDTATGRPVLTREGLTITVENTEPTLEIVPHTNGSPAPVCRYCESEEIYCDAGLCEECCHSTQCWIGHTFTSSEDEGAQPETDTVRNDEDTNVHMNEPTQEQTPAGPGMPPGGNNTTASEFNDIEHQPGPWSADVTTKTWTTSNLPQDITENILFRDTCKHAKEALTLPTLEDNWRDQNVIQTATDTRNWILQQTHTDISRHDQHTVVYFLDVVIKLTSRLYYQFYTDSSKNISTWLKR